MTFWEYLGTRCQQLLGAYQHTSAAFPHMTVTENIGLVPKRVGRPRALEVD
ncbi:hypothetical protein [Streptomyces sp. TM32]|uniref:hypothetical protein n=1 Tax=Streptomyces sp. TM32 TaxID=1652669 RepID=UPI0012AB38B6|nr:hypothetical protein [Streptomyces sp. TM32]